MVESRLELTQVKHLEGVPYKGKLLAGAPNIRLGSK
jgi:hypothetical protein